MVKRQKIWKTIDREKGDLDRFRRLTLPILGRMTEVTQDHRNIVSSIEKKDVDAAMKILREHLENVLTVVDILKEQHEPLFFLTI